MTAYLLEHKYAASAQITLFESSGRTGGKIITSRFPEPCATYEAGAAELYDYSQAGPDPLRELVRELGLTTRPMEGRAVFLGDQLLRTEDDLSVLRKSPGIGRIQGLHPACPLAYFSQRLLRIRLA